VIPGQLVDDELVDAEMQNQRNQVQHRNDDSYTSICSRVTAVTRTVHVSDIRKKLAQESMTPAQ